MIGRFIAGLGIGALSAACPLYQAETGLSRSQPWAQGQSIDRWLTSSTLFNST